MAAFRDKFNEKVVAEMRGVSLTSTFSLLAKSRQTLFSMDFSRADFYAVPGKSVYRRADAQTSYLYPLLI